MLGTVAGRVQRAHAQRSELELPAVLERLVVVLGIGVAVDVDRRAGRRGEAAVPGDVVGVVVRLEDVLDLHAHVAREREVLVDVELRVDDGGNAGVLVADQVGRAAEVVVGDLAEDHRPRRRCSTGRPASCHASMPPATLPAARPAAASCSAAIALRLPVAQMKAIVARSLGSSPSARVELVERKVQRAGHVAVARTRRHHATSTSVSSLATASLGGRHRRVRRLRSSALAPSWSGVSETDVGEQAVQPARQPPGACARARAAARASARAARARRR